MDFYAIDFETYYDDVCSIRTLGTDGYLNHPDFDAYMVTVYGPKGLWVGRPENFDWDVIKDCEWLSHNASFDTAVYHHLAKKFPDLSWPEPPAWHCTSDMAAYMGSGRSLQEAAFRLLGIKISKTVRDNMKGKRWKDMTPEFRKEVEKYAADDAVHCWNLWAKHSERWPETERRLSLVTRQMGWRGAPTDLEALQEDKRVLQRVIWTAEQRIPWAGEKDEKGKEIKITSSKQIAKMCRQVGIEAPASTADDDEDFAAWLDKYDAEYPWVRAVSEYRRANTIFKRVCVMIDRTREIDGRMGFALLYGGAHTLRWTAAGGFNTQNQIKAPLFIDTDYRIIKDAERLTEIEKSLKETGKCPSYVCHVINLRARIRAPKGKKFGISDLSQIEPRVLWWLVGDHEAMRLAATGMSPYEVHARVSMGWTGGKLKSENPKMYALAKARVLALGYGAGWQKFYSMALGYDVDPAIFDDPVPPEKVKEFEDYLQNLPNKKQWRVYESAPDFMKIRYCNSWIIVCEYRRSNPKIVTLWKAMTTAFKRSAIDGTYEVELPSGRSLKYQRVKFSKPDSDNEDPDDKGSYTAEIVKDGKMKRERFYGGKLVENCMAGNTEVLTKRGWVRLDSITTEDVVWDGDSWVSHDGLVCRGEQSVIDFGGVQITPDHKVLTTHGWVEAQHTTHEEAVAYAKGSAKIPKRINLVGQKFGGLTVTAFAGSDGRKRFWRVFCEFCGSESVKVGSELTKGRLKSCGCHKKQFISEGNRKHGMSRHPAFAVWRSMIDRCHLPSHQAFHNYGARGIQVCPEWRASFSKFWEDMGPTYAAGLTLDRINNDEGYCASNCRWASYATQARNKRSNRFIETPLGRMTVSEASEVFEIGRSTLYNRVRCGWPADKLFIPEDPTNRISKC